MSARASAYRRTATTFGIVVLLLGGFAALLPVEASASHGGTWTWRTRFVDDVTHADDYSGTRTFIRVTPAGQTMILYWNSPQEAEGFHPKIAEGPAPGDSFQTEEVHPADDEITGYGSFAVDSRGRPSVSYVSGIFLSEGVLKYARRTAGHWERIVVDRSKSVTMSALAVDSNDRPVIAYGKLGDELWLAARGPGGWTRTLVSHTRVQALDLAIDASDHPRIAYVAWDGSNYVARLVSFDGASWSTEDVGHVASQGIEFGIDLLLDSAGNPKIVFPILEPVQGMAIARRIPAGWRKDVIAKGNLWQPTAAFDASGAVNVVYYDAEDGALILLRRVHGAWLPQTVADSPSASVRIGRQSSIVFDAQDRARVSYYVGKQSGGTSLRYAIGTRA